MSRLLEIAEAFNAALGDHVMHDSTLTVTIFTNLIKDIRTRQQRLLIVQEKTFQPSAPEATALQPSRKAKTRASTPPPAYSHAGRTLH